MKYLTFSIFILLFSCSNYVQKMHGQMTKDSRVGRKSSPPLYLYNYSKNKSEGFLSNLNSSTNNFSSKSKKEYLPPIKRKYEEKKANRYTASDLIDSDNEGSLWNEKDQENFLFSKNNKKNLGDIIVVKVMEKLRNEIKIELYRHFSQRGEKLHSKKDAQTPNAQGSEPATEKKAEEKPEEFLEQTEEGKIFDKIPSIVSEEVNEDHLLLRGRKEVLFKKKKRVIELQALVSRKDLDPADNILSSKILEFNVSVIK